MSNLRISEVAALLGVSDDTVRRWCDNGRLTVHPGSGPKRVSGAQVAALAQELAGSESDHRASSARNQLRGIVTRVLKDTVMTQVEMQAGPFRVVSLMSTEAAEELDLAPGVVAVASVKATQVVVSLAGDLGR